MNCSLLLLLLQTLLPPHKCYLRVAYQIFDCFWLKYGNKIPKLKAPFYKDHILDAKLKKEDKE